MHVPESEGVHADNKLTDRHIVAIVSIRERLRTQAAEVGFL